MARNEIEGLVLLLDVGVSMSTKLRNSQTSYLQSCLDIIQMIVQRKMFQSSKDELALVLFGTRETANELWDGSSDHYRHVTLARPLSPVDWNLLEFIQNDINVSNLEGDILDGLVVASNHFHEDENKRKVLKEKRIIILTDFSSSAEDDNKINIISSGLSKHDIRVDVISPYSDENDDDDDEDNDDDEEDGRSNRRKDSNGKDKSRNDRASNNDYQSDDENKNVKPMTREQKNNKKILKQICTKTDGAMYSFDEVLTLLSIYQSKSIKSTGTKYMMTIGESFKMPIVSVIKCKENKPDLFKFKRVYAKDESVELKMDRARFTKDDEQRDLDDKTEVINAFKYGTTHVPIDDSDSLRLHVEKCFSVLGFTKSENVKRYYFLGESVYQILPDPVIGEEGEEAFVNMVHAMYLEDVYGLVRRVFSSRSSPELGCLIPHISNDSICLFYIALPFEDDMRKFTLENFKNIKKFKPNDNQLKLIDDLIDNMDLTAKTSKNDENDNDEEELYDPHLTFNPYLQRMYQSIALRATNPSAQLPDFDKHITNTHFVKIGEKIRNEKTLNVLKRCAEEFPTKLIVKKVKQPEENIFEKKNETKNPDENETKENGTKTDTNVGLDEILITNASNKIKKVGTVTPVEDFKQLAERLIANRPNLSADNDFDELCLQIQIAIRELFDESLMQYASIDEEDENAKLTVDLMQRKVIDSIRILRNYSIKFEKATNFNTYLRTFKIYLLNESNNKKYTKQIESLWQEHFQDAKLTLISSQESSGSDASEDESKEFIAKFRDAQQDVKSEKLDDLKEENDENLLDLM